MEDRGRLLRNHSLCEGSGLVLETSVAARNEEVLPRTLWAVFVPRSLIQGSLFDFLENNFGKAQKW